MEGVYYDVTCIKGRAQPFGISSKEFLAQLAHIFSACILSSLSLCFNELSAKSE